MDAHQIHSIRLEELLKNLNTIEEDTRNIEFILYEPVWKCNKTFRQLSMCDLIIGYNDKSFKPIELKYSKKGRPKALKQISQGYDFGFQHLQKPFIKNGKIVYYDFPFTWEEIEIPERYSSISQLEVLKNMYL